MTALTRRSVLRASLGLGAAGALARPHIVNAAATTAEVWWNQGFVPEEDAAFRAMVADYEKASGNKIDQSLVPFAPMRQKAVAAMQSGVVPDIIEVLDLWFSGLNVWDDKLLDISDVVEPQRAQFAPMALNTCYLYNNTAKKRSLLPPSTKPIY